MISFKKPQDKMQLKVQISSQFELQQIYNL